MLVNIWDGGCFQQVLCDSKGPYLPRPQQSAALFDLFLSFKCLTIACFRQISGVKMGFLVPNSSQKRSLRRYLHDADRATERLVKITDSNVTFRIRKVKNTTPD